MYCHTLAKGLNILLMQDSDPHSTIKSYYTSPSLLGGNSHEWNRGGWGAIGDIICSEGLL